MKVTYASVGSGCWSAFVATGLSLLGCSAGTPGPEAPSREPAPALAEIDRSGLPEPGETPKWGPPTPDSWTLSNGVRVIYEKHGAVPLVSVHLVVPRGSATDPVNESGLSELMSDLLDEGAGNYSALELSERLQSLSVDYSADATVDGVTLSMNTIAENFEPAMELLADIVLRPRLQEAEFERRKAQHVARALAREADPHSGRRVAMYRALFGDGYAGHVPTGTRPTLEAIGYDDVKSHYGKLIVAQGATIVVTGGIDKPTVERQLEKSFAEWGGESQVEVRAVTDSAASGKLFVVDYPGAPQSVIAAVRRAPGVDAEDLFEADVFNRSFGQSFASRVNLNLREDKGYTYGAASVFQRFKRAGFFGIFADVRTDVTRESFDEVLAELSQICGDRPLSQDERDTSVGGLLLGFPGSFESIDLLSYRFSLLALNERPIDWYSRWPGQIAGVTLEGANRAARRYCERSDFALVVAGDADEVAPRLESLEFERVNLDASGNPL